jgi:fatty-acyl-CoA synthase
MEEWLQKSINSIGQAFENIVRTYPDKEALVFREQRLTYKQLGDYVNQFAKGLIKVGVKKGDHVAIWNTNNLEWLYAQFAVHKLGATVIPVNTRNRALELEYVLQQADCNTLIFKDNFLGKIDTVSMVNGIMPALQNSESGKLAEKKLPLLKNVICLSDREYSGMFNFREIIQLGSGNSNDQELAKAVAATSPDDIGYIMYTSGTTGTSKGAMIPCRNTLALCYQYNHFHMLNEKSRVICAAPLHSNFGCNTSLLTAFLCGACACVLESWDTEEAFNLIQKEKISHLIVVPSMAIMMFNHPKLADYDLTSIEVWSSGGAPLPKELARAFMEKLQIKQLVHGYGLVEGAGIISTCSTQEAPIDVVATTVGKPWPYCRIKIVDPVTSKEVPDGKDGEIWSADNSNPPCHVMKGYYNKPKETAETITDGWLRTGDMGAIRDGSLTITGRLKDMILVGGFNVFPVEIEDVIRTHPKVKDASVVGIPDQRLQEVPMAFIQLKEGEESTEAEMIDFCQDKMSNLKVPRYIRFLTEFPLAGVGKVQKFRLREMAVKELNLGS